MVFSYTGHVGLIRLRESSYSALCPSMLAECWVCGHWRSETGACIVLWELNIDGFIGKVGAWWFFICPRTDTWNNRLKRLLIYVTNVAEITRSLYDVPSNYLKFFLHRQKDSRTNVQTCLHGRLKFWLYLNQKALSRQGSWSIHINYLSYGRIRLFFPLSCQDRLWGPRNLLYN